MYLRQLYKANDSLKDLMDAPTAIDPARLPRHVAIIMDGNGRWAKERGKDRIHGHAQGVHSVRAVVNTAGELGIKYLTLYAFSAENWKRPKAEVDALMELLVSTLRQEAEELKEKGVRLHVIGDVENLPKICQQELAEAIHITAGNTHLNLVLALSYSARAEVARAARLLAQAVMEQKIKPEDINEAAFTDWLYTKEIPDPELMIRTSGEHRISNFLLYQLAYAELYFTDVHWPDFRKEHFLEAIAAYQRRERRFGKTSEQISAEQSTPTPSPHQS